MNSIKTVFLMSLMIVLFIFVGQYAGGRDGAAFAFMLAIGMNFMTYFFSDKIVLTMYGAKEIDPSRGDWLLRMGTRLAERAGIPMPRLYIIESPQPNAFATGRGPSHSAVAFSSGLLNNMSREEIEGVFAHEIAHIKNRDTLTGMIVAAFAGAIMFLSDMVRWAAIFGGGSRDDRDHGGIVGHLAMIIIAPLAATMIQLAISRSREFAADETAARITGNPLGLASALEKLGYISERLPANASPATAHMFTVNPLSGAGVFSIFSTHPPIEDRIRRLYELAGIAR